MTITTRLISSPRSPFAVNDFWQAGDTVNDWIPAFHRVRDYILANTPGGIVYAPDGVYPVLDTINYRDLTKPIVLRGAGRYSTLIYGNFTGPSKYIIDTSFTINALRIQGVYVERLSICGNGVVGDPRGLGAHRSFQQNFDEVHIVGAGETLCGATRKLWNTSLVSTQINNSKYTRLTLKGSWAPDAFSLSSTVRFSGSASSTSLTSNEDCFTAAMNGHYIVLAGGGGSGDSVDYFVAKLTYVSPTSATLDTALGATISGVRGSIGFVTGSMTNGVATLALDTPSAQSGMVGMLVGVLGADVKTDAGNTKGWLWTEVSAYVDASTLTLRDVATADASAALVCFAPACFFGTPKFEDTETRQTNDFQLWGIQAEGGTSAGMVFSRVIDCRMKQSKIEMRDFANAGSSKNGAMIPLILDEIKQFSWQDGGLNFGSHPLYGSILVSGSRGMVDIKEINRSGYLPDQPIIHVTDEITTGFEAIVEDFRLSDGVGKFSASYTPQRVPASKPDAVRIKNIHGRLIADRSWGNDKIHPGYNAGRYYQSMIAYTPGSPTSAQTANLLYVYPIVIDGPVWISALNMYIAAAVGSTHALPGLYETVYRATGHARPGKLIAAGAALDTSQAPSTLGFDCAFSSNILIPARGVYWMGTLIDGAANLRALLASNYQFAAFSGGLSAGQIMGNVGENIGFTKSQAYSDGLPTDLSSAAWTALATETCPFVLWKAA